MKRNMEKALEDYKKIASNGKYAIYASDLEQVKQKYIPDNGTRQIDLFGLISDAMMYGVVIGYQSATRKKKSL